MITLLVVFMLIIGACLLLGLIAGVLTLLPGVLLVIGFIALDIWFIKKIVKKLSGK